MKDYMLTVWSAGIGPRDVQVNRAPDMLTAISLAEKATGCRVDHGRSGIGKDFDPNIIIDGKTGVVNVVHDKPADSSMQIVGGVKVTVPRGEGKR